MNQYGFVRITCASPRTAVANPAANAAEIVRILDQLPDSDIVLYPELCVTGYTCGDLFGQSTLLDAGIRAILRIAQATAGRAQLVVVGAPIPAGNSLFNCAVVINDGSIRGIVPKQYIPNYKEFYELRWFSPATGNLPAEIELGGQRVPFGIDLLFEAKGEGGLPGNGSVLVGVEICEDLWVPVPPSALQAMAGATILLNLSASNETIGKSRYRTDLVVGQSGRTISAYAMAGSGPSESTTDVVFGGHCLIAENGRLLAESPRVGDGQPIRRDSYSITHDVDVAKLLTDRRVTTSFDDGWSLVKPFRLVPFSLAETHGRLEARGTGHAVRTGGRARASPPLRRDLRHPVRRAGQANRAAPAEHAAQSRYLRRPRFHARASGHGHDVRHARPRPPADPRPDHARLRHDPAHPDQCPGTDGTSGRRRRDDRHQRAGTPDIPGNRPRAVRHRLPRPRRGRASAPPWPACPAKP